MCTDQEGAKIPSMAKTIPVTEAIGMVLAHDITEIKKDEFKGRAFKKGHIVRNEDICHLQRLGKERLFVLEIGDNEIHEDDAALRLANLLMGEGARADGEPKEGKMNIRAERDGLLRVDREALFDLNMLGDVMCATLHNNTVVKRGTIVAGTRAIPLVVSKKSMEDATTVIQKRRSNGLPGTTSGVIEVKEMRRPRAGAVITGNEVYYGRIKDVFAPIITEKIRAFNGEMVGISYAPDKEEVIEERLRELLRSGADLLITTGGMSVDPDDVTRFAIRNLGAHDISYGSAALPGAMFLVASVNHQESGSVPILGIPACAMYHRITVLDLILPRILAGEKIGRRELAELGHGGLCLNCRECRFPVCPFGK
jgi:hypothetical protein